MYLFNQFVKFSALSPQMRSVPSEQFSFITVVYNNIANNTAASSHFKNTP